MSYLDLYGVLATMSTSFSEKRSGGKVRLGTARPTPLKTGKCVVGDFN